MSHELVRIECMESRCRRVTYVRPMKEGAVSMNKLMDGGHCTFCGTDNTTTEKVLQL